MCIIYCLNVTKVVRLFSLLLENYIGHTLKSDSQNLNVLYLMMGCIMEHYCIIKFSFFNGNLTV